MTALALLYYHTGKNQLSLHYVNKLLRLNPKDVIIKKLKANLSLKEDNIQESIEAFSQIVSTDAKLKEFYHTLDNNKNNKIIKTIKDKTKTIESQESKSKKDWLDLSLLHFFDGRPEKAMEYLKTASK